MNTTAKKFLTLGLAAALATSLTACDNPFADHMLKDSEVYVQGKLDTYYKGSASEDYLKLLEMTEDEVKEEYEDGLLAEAEYFMYYFNITDYDDEMLDTAADMYREIYKAAKYTIKPATATSDGNYIVTIEVEPMDIMSKVTEEDVGTVDEQVLSAMGFTYDNMDTMTDEQYAQYDAAFSQAMVDLVTSRISTIGYEPAKSVAIQINSEDGETYSMVGDDFSNLDEMIISY